MPMPVNGEVEGSLTLKSSGSIAPEDFLKYHPETKAYLDDILQHGWKYVCTEAKGTALAHVTSENSRYWLGAAPAFMRTASVMRATGIPMPEYNIVVYLGTALPEVEGVLEVKEFRVNISSKSYPAAAAVELVKGVVFYLHDPFWKWEKGWEADKKKVEDAMEIYEIATWLLDVKKFKLLEGLKPERYQELVETFKALPH